MQEVRKNGKNRMVWGKFSSNGYLACYLNDRNAFFFSLAFFFLRFFAFWVRKIQYKLRSIVYCTKYDLYAIGI